MSIQISFEKNVRSSDVIRAASVVFPIIPSTDVWIGLDHMDVFGRGRSAEKKAYFDSQKYLFAKNALSGLDGLWVEIESDLPILPSSNERLLSEYAAIIVMPEKHTPKQIQRAHVRFFVLTLMKEYYSQLRREENRCMPNHLRSFLENTIGVADVQCAIVPRGGLELRLPMGQVFIVKKFEASESCSLGARGLAYKEACAFLEALPPTVSCRVLREGVNEQAFVGFEPVSCALNLIRRKDGRRVLHRKLPPFTDDGTRIPL